MIRKAVMVLLFGLIGFCVLPVIAFGLYARFYPDPSCPPPPAPRQSTSPDAKYIATVYSRPGCYMQVNGVTVAMTENGAPTPLFYFVNRPDDILSLGGSATGVSVQWTDVRHLVVDMSGASLNGGCQLTRQKYSWRDVSITYQGSCPLLPGYDQ
jgi:hypothetical protein